LIPQNIWVAGRAQLPFLKALTRDTSNRVVTKSDLCPKYENAVCVANCPNEALFVVEHSKVKASQVVKA
jgi:Fe-S-cluster-containing hydrogenase component 2